MAIVKFRNGNSIKARGEIAIDLGKNHITLSQLLSALLSEKYNYIEEMFDKSRNLHGYIRVAINGRLLRKDEYQAAEIYNNDEITLFQALSGG